MAKLGPKTNSCPPLPCPECPCKGRRVGSRGQKDSAVVIVGEAPGAEEIAKGVPFIGPSGDILDRGLGDFELDDAYVLNSMQCRPPKLASQYATEQRKREGVNACRGRLQEQLWEHPREVIIALGNYACMSVLNNPNVKITQIRGNVIEVEDPVRNTRVPVVPVIHPAALLRGTGSFPQFLADIQRALSIASQRTVNGNGEYKVLGVKGREWLAPEFELVETATRLREVWLEIRAASRKLGGPLPCAFDTETGGFNWLQDSILCIGIYPVNSPNKAYILNGDPSAPEHYARTQVYKQMLGDRQHIHQIWQGGKFDLRFHWRRNLPARVDEDTLLLSYALNEKQGAHAIEEQMKALLGAPEYKHVLKKWAPKKTDSYAKVPLPVLDNYLATDVKGTAEVWKITNVKVKEDKDLLKLYTRTLVPACGMLTRMEMRGIQTDPFYVAKNRKTLEAVLAWLTRRLEHLTGGYVNPNSPQQVAQLLYGRLGLRLKGKIPKDTLKETLDKLPPHPVVKAIRSYRSIGKMLSTYVKAIEVFADEGGRVHTTYKLWVTPTGRLASEAPNIQNIPRKARYRRMYCAPKGRKLIEGDYNTAELRMLGCLSQDEFLTSVFCDNSRNLHDEVAVAMYGPNWSPDQRIRAKAINFGIPYGRKAPSIAEEFDMPTSEAQRLIEAWFDRAPEAADFIARCRAAPLRNQSLTTIFGRKRRPGIVSRERLDELQNEFANFFHQSTVSDFTLHAAMELESELEHYDAYLVNLIHDSTLTEAPDDPVIIKKCATLIRDVMESVPRKWIKTPIPFLVDLKVGTHWGLLKGYQL